MKYINKTYMFKTTVNRTNNYTASIYDSDLTTKLYSVTGLGDKVSDVFNQLIKDIKGIYSLKVWQFYSCNDLEQLFKEVGINCVVTSELNKKRPRYFIRMV